MKNKFENLLKPLKIGGITIKNRLCMGPMGAPPMGSLGEFNEATYAYYVERAKGGFGLIFSGATFTDLEVDPKAGDVTPIPFRYPAIFMGTSQQLIERVHAYGTKMFMQISMGLGRNYGLPAPSEVTMYGNPDVKSRALTIDEIKKKIEFMVNAALMSKNAGFDGVEVHAMHWGYLLDEFAMSIINKRTDEYGGSLENRMRVAKEIIEGIKQTCGADFPVTMRLGLKSYIKGLNEASLTGEDEAGRTLEEGIKISSLLESYGYDALNVDVGVYDSFYHAAAPMYMPKGHVLDLAKEAKKAVKIPILTGSRMDDPFMCEEAIIEGKTDGVVLARASLADPHFAKKVEMGIPEKIRPCIACHQGCIGRVFTKGANCSCAVNPQAGRELNYRIDKALKPKKVVVVGGGVAGMEAARVASLRGHEVFIYEKSDKLGGHLISGGAHSFKTDVQRLNEWYQGEVSDLKVSLNLESELNAEMIKSMGADAVVLSVGSSPIMPNVPGINNKNVSSSIEALLHKKEIGKNVVIVGGGLVGCELALEYAKEGKSVTIVEMLNSILSAGEPVPLMNAMMLMDLLKYHNVKIYNGYKLESVSDDGVKIIPVGDGENLEINADSVIIAIGFKPLASMASELYGEGIEIYEVGDGNKVSNILSSIWQAYEVGRLI